VGAEPCTPNAWARPDLENTEMATSHSDYAGNTSHRFDRNVPAAKGAVTIRCQ